MPTLDFMGCVIAWVAMWLHFFAQGLKIGKTKKYTIQLGTF